MSQEIEFNKYKNSGSVHWREMTSRDIRVFNAVQQARYDWIIKIAGQLDGKNLLDVGCGDGALTYLMASRGAHVTAIDNDELGLKCAQENLASKNRMGKLQYEFLYASAYQLPFAAESFDLVVSCEVIEHVAEPNRMLAEASRVLKRNGKFILTTPHRMTETPHDPNHVIEYFPREVQVLLGKYFVDVGIKLTHHVLWTSLYTYGFRNFRNRTFGRWLLNIPVLLMRWNPFMIDYKNPTKFDRFAGICAWGIKK